MIASAVPDSAKMPPLLSTGITLRLRALLLARSVLSPGLLTTAGRLLFAWPRHVPRPFLPVGPPFVRRRALYLRGEVAHVGPDVESCARWTRDGGPRGCPVSALHVSQTTRSGEVTRFSSGTVVQSFDDRAGRRRPIILGGGFVLAFLIG